MQEAKRFIKKANQSYDPTRPLTYRGGFEHIGCGGEAERPSNVGAGAYCKKCETTVPVESTRRI